MIVPIRVNETVREGDRTSNLRGPITDRPGRHTQWHYSVFSQERGFIASGWRETEAKARAAIALVMKAKTNRGKFRS